MIVNKEAFTLIEVILVIALVALLACLGMMQLSFLDSTIARMEVDKLSVVCSFLQQHAIVTNSEQVLKCDVLKNEYHFGSSREIVSRRIAFDFLKGTMGSPGNPNHSITKAITFAGSSIHFYPTGIISSGTIYLVDKNNRYMYALSNAISQVSHVRLYRYDGGKWKIL